MQQLRGVIGLGVVWLLLAAAPCGGLKAMNWTEPCNKDIGNCELRVDEVTWAGTHNADSTGLKIKYIPIPCLSDNHEHHVVKELEEGLRYFDIDTCLTSSRELYICHGIAYGRLFKPEMVNIKAWMDANPREVVIIEYGNAKNEEGSAAGAQALMSGLTSTMQEVFGEMLLVPPMHYGRLLSGWPKLGDLVDQNKRMIVLWGKPMYFQIFTKGKTTPGFRDLFIWSEKYWAGSYSHEYTKMMVPELEHSLEHFCDNTTGGNFNKKQPMIRVAGFLTIDASRLLDICNKDLAGEVNPALLEYDHLDTNPLLTMQTNCWAKQKQVSLLSMDYVEYFPQRLDRMGRKLNERNFARFGWIGGKMSVSGAQASKTEDELKALLVKLAGLETPDRISVEQTEAPATTRRLHGDKGRSLEAATDVHFSISAPENGALTEPPNAVLLMKMREAAQIEEGVDAIKAVCRDPGTPTSATRDHAAQTHFEEGTKLVFTCVAPLIAHGSLERTCGPDGLFDGMQPSCLEAWTTEVRLIPDWLKVVLAISVSVCLLGCLCGCLCLCMKKCKGGQNYDQLRAAE